VEKNWTEFLGTFSIPIFFLLGVIISGYLTEKRLVNKVHGQKYAPVMALVSLLLLIVAIMGNLNFFGEFGHPTVIRQDFILLALLCGACGLQNAAITSASGATIRTTHLTGLATDLGLGLVKAKVHTLSIEEKKNERRANLLRVCTIIAFTFGSAIAAFIYLRFKYNGFYFPTAIAFYAFWSARK
jgi:uncharacterized membrane protein YoaK (UPF0700 family)